jgi:hypothetical protein
MPRCCRWQRRFWLELIPAPCTLVFASVVVAQLTMGGVALAVGWTPDPRKAVFLVMLAMLPVRAICSVQR